MASSTWTASAAGSFATAGNYDTNSAPASGDSLKYNSLSTYSVTSGLSATGVNALTLDITAGYTGKIGVEATGTTAATYLTLGTSGTQVVYIGRDDGGSSGAGPQLVLVKPNSSGTVNVYVYKSGSAATSYPAVRVLGQAVNLYCYGGETGVALMPGETATLTALTLGTSPQAGASGNPIVRLGSGATLPATLNIGAGTCYSRSSDNITTANIDGGATYIVEAECTATHGTINVYEGRVIYNGTGAVTTVNVYGGATFDMSQDQASGKAVTTINAYEGSTVLLDNGVNGSITVTTVSVKGDPRKVSLSKPVGMSIALA